MINECVRAVCLETASYAVLLFEISRLGVENSISFTGKRYREASLAPLIRGA